MSNTLPTITTRTRLPALFERHPDLVSLVVVGLVALVFRVAFTGRAPAFLIGDSENYFLPGYELARGLGFDPELRRTPGYPLFIATMIRLLGEDLHALVFAQHLLGVVTAGLTYAIGRLVFGAPAGLAAGLLSAISGTALIGEHTVMAEAVFTPLFVGHIALLIAGVRRRAVWLFALAGLVLGLAALVRPVALAWVPALPVALLAVGLGVPSVVKATAVSLGCAALVLLPWMARNQLVHSSFSADGSFGQTLVGRTLRHDSGFVFFDPQMPTDADPRRDRARRIMQESVGRTTFLTPVRRRIRDELGLSEAETNRLMREIALEAILRQPGYYVQSTLANFVRLSVGVPERFRDAWASRREARNREEWEAQTAIRHLIGPPTTAEEREQRVAEGIASLYQPARWGPWLVLGFIAGTVAAIRRPGLRTGLIPALATIALLGAAVALVAPLPRYRFPVEPLIAVVAAGGVIEIAHWLAARLGRPFAGRTRPAAGPAVEPS